MDVLSALVANHAEIEGDKLYVSGGAWAWLTTATLPQELVVNLALVLADEPSDDIESVLVRIYVRTPGGATSYGTELLVKWPKPSDLHPGQPIVVPVVLFVPFKASKAGRHSLEVFLDDDGVSRRSVPFAVVWTP
ncbi:MAG: hypothetical protein M3O28_14940 [Actinomycetota bacterium]|nr:hypothetical protein [Actinomycetota bacterium]